MTTHEDLAAALRRLGLTLERRDNVLQNWPDDEAEAYRNNGGWQQGMDAVRDLRAAKLAGELNRILPRWMNTHQLATIPHGPKDPAEDDNYESHHVNTNSIDEAEIILSHEIDSDPWEHRPVLDIDFPVHVVPSSTPGHFHLYLNKKMTWGKYKNLLRALMEAGILESGYVIVSMERGYTSVRLPWVKKESRP